MMNETIDNFAPDTTHDEWVETQLRVLNKNKVETARGLAERAGIEYLHAETIVERVQQRLHKKKAMRDIWIGGAWLVGGTIITVATYSAASNSGGTYYITWGPIVFGGIQMIRGIANALSTPQNNEF